MGEPFGFDARFDIVDACLESNDIFNEVHDLVSTSFEGCRCECVLEESPSLCFNYAFPNLLEHSHVPPMCSQPSVSPEYSLDVPVDNSMIFNANIDLGYEDKMFNILGGNVDNFLSLGYFSWYNASLDPYCVSLEDLPRKIK